MFTNEDILRVALEQSAIDSNCNWEDFLKKDNVIVTSVANPETKSQGLFHQIQKEVTFCGLPHEAYA